MLTDYFRVYFTVQLVPLSATPGTYVDVFCEVAAVTERETENDAASLKIHLLNHSPSMPEGEAYNPNSPENAGHIMQKSRELLLGMTAIPLA